MSEFYKPGVPVAERVRAVRQTLRNHTTLKTELLAATTATAMGGLILENPIGLVVGGVFGFGVRPVLAEVRNIAVANRVRRGKQSKDTLARDTRSVPKILWDGFANGEVQKERTEPIQVYLKKK